MKKVMLALIAVAFTGTAAWSQTDLNGSSVQLIDEGEEPVTSLQEILDVQQDLVKREQYSAHIEDVWKHAGFFNVVYHNPGTITFLGSNANASSAGGSLYTANYGFGIQSGKNHKLHKKPIGRMVSINLDYLPLDLYANLYNDTNCKLPYGGDSSMPESGWDYRMFEVNYSMSIGPSITIAPFVPLKIKGLSFFKFNAYFHVGYSASLLMLSGINSGIDADGRNYSCGVSCTDFGHGMYTSYGANFSWKAIGVGYERRSGTSKYISLNDAGGQDGNFILSAQNRIYVNFRF